MWLSSWALIHLEGHMAWGIYTLHEDARAYLRFAGLAGLGFAL